MINERVPRMSQGSFISNRSLGREMPFGDVRQSITDEEASRAWCDFCIDILFLLFVVVLLEFSINVGQTGEYPITCGIPILMWHRVLFFLFGLRSLANLLKIYIIRNFYSRRNYYNIMRFAVADGLIIAWLIYGNVLYYSKRNNCEANERTQFLAEFMGCILIIGYIMMGFYLLILCTLPWLYFLLRRQAAEVQLNAGPGHASRSQVPLILDSLSKVPFSAGNFNHDTQCAICFVDYKTTDLVTQLECDPRHYFHTECIESWIKSGNNSCPICRNVIHGFDVEDIGSEVGFDVA